MRKDLILYIIAGAFFIITAISLILNTGQLYVVSTVLGIAFASAGFLLKPKVTVAPVATTETVQPVASAPAEQVSSAAVPTVTVETPAAIVPKAETPLVEASAAPTAIAVQAPVVAEPAPPAEVSAPIAETPVPAASPAATANFTQIHGINAKRADQLKANGINSIEELAKASPADLAAKLQVSEKIVKMWIGSAKKLAK